ncbi:MAG: polyprenyl diphosphate synthase [Bacteriovoracaceae bacterium]
MSEINHVAIIMDGNGRWAQKRFHPRVWGHIRGSSIVSSIVEEADELGLKALTLYAFSTENFSRPLTEVKTLFSLLKKFLLKEKPRLIKNQVRFRVIGDIASLPLETQELIEKLQNETKDFKGLKLSFAFGYGSRAEIVKATNNWITKNPGVKMTEAHLNEGLFLPDAGDVDLIIRTGGEQRISNFLLWQSAYAELYFTMTAWPDFTPKEFALIIDQVKTRQRRFGTTGASAYELSQIDAKTNYQKLKTEDKS